MAATSRDQDLDLISTIGPCGRFQVMVTLTANLATAACVWGTMFMAFGNFHPGWACLDDVTTNQSVAVRSYSATTDALWSSTRKNQNVSAAPDWKYDCEVKAKCQKLLINTDSSTVATQWDLTCDSSWLLSIIVSIEMAGGLVGCYVSGQVGDRFGRRVALYSQLALHCVTHTIMAFSTSWKMYAATSFFNGLSAGGIITNAYPYPLEFVNEWWRGVVVAIPEWNISFIIFAALVFFIRDWQFLHIASAILSALIFLTVFLMPESVRWLAVHGRVQEAKRVVRRIAHMNGNSVQSTHIIDNIADEEKARMGGYTYTYLDLIKIPTLRSYLLKFSFIWVTMSLLYYGLSFGMRALSGDFYVNLLISAVLELPATVFVGPAVNVWGRRTTAIVFFLIEVACCLALTVISLVASGSAKDTSVLVLALFCKMIIVGSWGVGNVYAAEVVPTVVRSLHYGSLVAVSRLANIVSPFVIPNDPDQLYISFAVLALLGLVCCGLLWSLPETKGQQLKDTTREMMTKHRPVPEATPMNTSAK